MESSLGGKGLNLNNNFLLENDANFLLLCELSNIELIHCRWFSDFKELDYARSGNVATQDVSLDAGTVYIYINAIFYSN